MILKKNNLFVYVLFMKNVKIVLLSIFALLCVLAAIFVVIATNKIDKMIEEETQQPVQVVQDEIDEDVVNHETVDALQESFDALFSWENVEDFYEGETDFGFVGAANVEEE